MRRESYGFLLVGCFVLAGPAVADEDFGDSTSATLTGKAWAALASGDFARVSVFTGRCRELYADEAAKQQAGLKDFLPADKVHDMWALNDVGTCCFIEGQALEKQGRNADAAAAYKQVVESYGFAQCWDPKGWFWRPAEAASRRLAQLEFDKVLDAK